MNELRKLAVAGGITLIVVMAIMYMAVLLAENTQAGL